MLGSVPIYYKKVDKNVKLPTYSNEGDAGMDVYSNIDIHIKPQETKLINLGIKIEIPFGYELQVRPRSGLSLNTPLRISNSPGTIDCGYRGELCVIVTNTSEKGLYTQIYDLDHKGNAHGVYKIKKYDRIAQIVLAKVEIIRWKEGSMTISARNENGFGSTGT